MRKRIYSKRELLDRWKRIQEDEDADDPSLARQRQILQAKEEWFLDSFNFLADLPTESHIWCGFSDLMGPLLETFHSYFSDKNTDSPLKLIWRRVSQELGKCIDCICQHHQAQETYSIEYEHTAVPLLKVLRFLDEERVTEQLRELNARIRHKEYDTDCYSADVISVMFEVLMFPKFLDDQSLATEFQFFIEEIDKSHDLTLAGNQQYPGVYALLFLKSGRARAIGLRLAGCMGKLRKASDLEPLQPLLRKYIGVLETEVPSSTVEESRPRVQIERATVWLGIKTLLGFLEASAFEEGILERYPIFLSIVLNNVSDDTFEFSYAITCLRESFEMLGCKLWWRTTVSPSMMRNTLLGQCFHTRNEKSHKEIFDLFLPFLQSLEALQDGEHEKQRRHFLYFLLHQVTQSSNFSVLMRKHARKIALLIIHRGYKMNPPCPPFECAHMWGPPLVNSLKDSSLHSSLRQPAFDLINTIIISDASALLSQKLKHHAVSYTDTDTSGNYIDDEDELTLSHDVEEESSCWSEFSIQSKLVSHEFTEWTCVPMLWFDALIEVDPSFFPIPFSKAVFWALSHMSMIHADSSIELSLSVRDWLSSFAGEISKSFGWQVPSGADDGGDGKESRNSIKVSTMCGPLIRTFKRFSVNFIIKMEEHELQKQWTWEPRMAESLILLLIDPNDTIRKADRVILEHVSKARDLTSSLQFLCSSASSLSSLYLGLRCALEQVQIDSILANFRSLHHLFFVVGKLLKDVIKSRQNLPTTGLEDPKYMKFSSEGGFLRQPLLDNAPASAPGCSAVADMKSWEKFSYVLSSIMWPCILKCLVGGKELMDSKNQITCVRLLETLPIVFERISTYTSKLLVDMVPMVSGVFDFKWFCDLVDWGNSSLTIITKRWKQCMLSFLNLFKGSNSGATHCTIGVIEAIISLDTVNFDKLKEEVLRLTISLSNEASSMLKEKIKEAKPLISETSLREKILSPEIRSDFEKDARHVSVEPVQKTLGQAVIILSDDEEEKETSPHLVGSPLRKSSKFLLGEALPPGADKILSSDGQMEFVGTSSSEDILAPFPSRVFSEDKSLSYQKQRNGMLEKNRLLSEGSVKDKGTDNLRKASESSKSLKEANSVIKEPSGQHVKGQVSAQTLSLKTSKTDVESEKENAVIRELVFDNIDDPLEWALDSVRRPQSAVPKLDVLASKRKVIQLHMPTNNKSGFLNRTDPGNRRLKPPRLDDWYRPILELDFFAIVGLASARDDEDKTSTNLQKVPLCFQSPSHYVEIFQPLVLEEFKAQLQNSYIETSSDDLRCGSLYIISVERIDDFHIVRGRPDSESATCKDCLENDLVLLTKEPLQNSVQHTHVLGKVERREKCNKSRSMILVIRFYLPNSSSRLNKVRRLLIERSKWSLNRIMSITPQLREFQALSSLQDIPMLPVILRPIGSSLAHSERNKIELRKLSKPLQDMLKSSFNDSQLQAISIAIETHVSTRSFELSLIQGPPGTGKTRTIIAIVSALLDLRRLRENCSSKSPSSSSKPSAAACINPRKQLSESVAIARAWQDAAFAKQISKDAEKESSGSAGCSAGGRVLICAQSNAAVDELVSRINGGLYGNDGKLYKPYLVRVGNAKTVHPNSLPYFIDTLVEQRLAEDKVNDSNAKNDTSMQSSSSLRAKLEKLVDNIRYYESKRAKLNDGNVNTKASLHDESSKENEVHEMSDAAIGVKLNILYGQKKALSAELAIAHSRERKVSEESRSIKLKIRKSILKEAEIVVTTLSGCGGDLYGVCSESASNNRFGKFSEQCLFDVVVIDEAAQALEPATLIPLQLLKLYGTKCIMVGDPKQLPATVISNVASKFLYECSMFERLQRAGHPVIMLTEQYRMHPEICRFPSLHFYENKLLNGARMADKSAPFHENAYLGPYMFFDIIDGCENKGKNSGALSLYNESEAEAAVGIMKFLKKRYPSEFVSGRIGIITPYRSQLSLLRSRFSGAFGPNIVCDMEFNTVDGFQGREVDILILSTVRASDSGNKPSVASSSSIGFVADVRRMNVALTRAKYSLWIVGNARTLQTNLHWAALVQNARERKLFISISRPYNAIFGTALSSIENLSCSRLDSHDQPKHGDKVRDVGCGVQHVRKNAKGVNLIDGNLQSHSKGSKNSGKHTLPSHKVLMDESRHFKDRYSTTAGRPMLGGEDNGNKSQKQKTEATSQDTSKNNPKCKRQQDDTIHADGELETDSDIRKSIKKAKDAWGFSEQGTSRTVSQGSALSSSEKRVSKTNVFLPSKLDNASKNLMQSRKRQRDAVESLLSSNLISSKKPETASNPPLVRRPPPTARDIVKPSK